MDTEIDNKSKQGLTYSTYFLQKQKRERERERERENVMF